MATETVVSFFNQSGIPVTGLTPTIQAIDPTGDSLFSGVMTDIGGGWYKYIIENYNKGATYLISVDGGPGISSSSRWQQTTNLLDAYPNKLDWRSISTWIIDYKEIAKAVWESPLRSGSFTAVFPDGFSYEIILEKFEEIKRKIEGIDFPTINIPEVTFPEIPKGITKEEIKELLEDIATKEDIDIILDTSDVLSAVNESLIAIYKKIGEISNDDVIEKFDKLGLERIIGELKDIHSKIGEYDNIMKNAENLPVLVDNYKNIVKSMQSTAGLEEKIAHVRMVAEDILRLVK